MQKRVYKKVKPSAIFQNQKSNQFVTKYTAHNKGVELNRILVRGRYPADEDLYFFESEMHLVLYIVRGSGKVYLNEEIQSVNMGDTVNIPPGTSFAVEGSELEYLAMQDLKFSAGGFIEEIDNILDGLL